MTSEDDMVDFNIKLKEIVNPPLTETDIIYKDDKHKLLQVIGIDNTNRCIIKEVGIYNNTNKKEHHILLHKTFIDECWVNLYTHLYKMDDIQNIDKLILIRLEIIYENENIGEYQFCFISDNKDINKELIGKYCIYNVLDDKITSYYDKYIGASNAMNELINSIN
jgi:hypothetical protein